MKDKKELKKIALTTLFFLTTSINNSFAKEWWADDYLCKNYGTYCSQELSKKQKPKKQKTKNKTTYFVYNSKNIPKNLEYLLKVDFENGHGISFKKAIKRLSSYNCGKNNCLVYLKEETKKNKSKVQNWKNHFDYLIALGYIESGLNKNIKSYKGAIGLFQFMPQTGKNVCNLSKTELYNPKKNIDCVIKYSTKIFNHPNAKRPNHFAAGHNGGGGALNYSKSCKGELIYECKANHRYKESRKFGPMVYNMYKRIIYEKNKK